MAEENTPATSATDAQAQPLKRKSLAISIRDKAVLYAAYMPFLKNGGLFIPTKKEFRMGEDCNLTISLLEDTERDTVPCKVVWITPVGSPGNRAGGIGVEFADTPEGDTLRRKIEELLGPLMQSNNATHTM